LDFPRFSVNNGIMVAEANSAGYTPWLSAMGRKPLVYALAVEDLIEGKPYPRSHKIYPQAFFGTQKFPKSDDIGDFDEAYPDVFPIAHHGYTANTTFLVRGEGKSGKFDVFSFKHPTDWTDFPTVDGTTATLTKDGNPVEIRSMDTLPVFRDGKIYYVWHKLGPSNGTTELRAIRLMRVDFAGGTLWYQTFGSDTVTNECPSITVTKDGHIVIVHGRRGYSTPLNHEARYSVWYADNRGFQAGEVIGPGEYLPNAPQYCGSPPSKGIADYIIAVIDPTDENSAWLIANFPDKSDSASESDKVRAIVARVTP
jgi:hypothetical protein